MHVVFNKKIPTILYIHILVFNVVIICLYLILRWMFKSLKKNKETDKKEQKNIIPKNELKLSSLEKKSEIIVEEKVN